MKTFPSLGLALALTFSGCASPVSLRNGECEGGVTPFSDLTLAEKMAPLDEQKCVLLEDGTLTIFNLDGSVQVISPDGDQVSYRPESE